MTILVTGGSGRLGRAVLGQLGAEGVAGMRRPGATGAVLIDSEGNVDPAALVGVTAIVNCAGRVTGTQAELDLANVQYPVAIARAARDAGVARFVQVSSFSVYGRVERIDAFTPIAPENDYGYSKVSAERALEALCTARFETIALRLPFMFSAHDPALIGRLVTLVRRAHLLPVRVNGGTYRSMITYSGAAEALLAAAQGKVRGSYVSAAADVTPLDLSTIARLLQERGYHVATLPMPNFAISAAAKVAPAIADRLFRSSVLADDANLMRDGTAHPVEAELIAYIHQLKRVSARQPHQRW